MLAFTFGACCCARVQQGAVLSYTQDSLNLMQVVRAWKCSFKEERFQVRCSEGRFTEVFTWTYAEASNNPNNTAHTDVAQEGQLRL